MRLNKFTYEELKRSMLLYAVTDSRWLGGRKLKDDVRAAIEGGATFVQLREKNLGHDDFLALANEIKPVCEEYHVPFVINDKVKIALECGADGVHVGQSDMEAHDVRALIGPNMILGVSAQTVDQAKAAEAAGADYLGVGAVFPTGSKDDAAEVSHETLKAICDAVKIPVVAIGGINKENVKDLSGSGIDGIAVISAIFAKDDIESAARELLMNIDLLS